MSHTLHVFSQFVICRTFSWSFLIHRIYLTYISLSVFKPTISFILVLPWVLWKLLLHPKLYGIYIGFKLLEEYSFMISLEFPKNVFYGQYFRGMLQGLIKRSILSISILIVIDQINLGNTRFKQNQGVSLLQNLSGWSLFLEIQFEIVKYYVQLKYISISYQKNNLWFFHAKEYCAAVEKNWECLLYIGE